MKIGTIVFTSQPAVKSVLGSLSRFFLSMSYQKRFLCQHTAKLSHLCKSCKGVKIALNPPHNTTYYLYGSTDPPFFCYPCLLVWRLGQLMPKP